jgi:2-oxoglutarate ferredoxin oxidoreductase subunit gamma
MKTEIICAGFGGQGVLTAGLIIAQNCINEDKNVTWIPSYGAEMRGGTANCNIKISDKEISSPFVTDIDILIALNEPSLDKFEKNIKPGGLLFVNSSLIADRDYRQDVKVVLVPMTELANEANNPRGANLAMLGAFVEKSSLFDKDLFSKGIDDFFTAKGKVNKGNAICFKLGWDYAHKN